jgi:hypothetical protein
MTKITANLILLIMACTWAYLSITEGILHAVSDQFVYLALALASGEGLGLITQRFGGKVVKNDNPPPAN